MKFLPILPFLKDYPFLRPSKHVLGKIEKGVVFDFALENAKKMLKDLLERGSADIKPEEKSLFCFGCDKPCREFCRERAITDRIEWERCNLCSECFRNCMYHVSPDIYREYELNARVSALSYIMMRSAVSQFSDATRRRFATSLARSYRNAMENDRSEVLPEMMASNFGIRMFRNEGIAVHVTSYLKASSRIKSPEWKLYNRSLKNGFVELSLREFYRIVEEHLRDLFSERMPEIEGIEPLKEIVMKYEGKRKYERIKGVKDFSLFPPCMKKILSDLESSVNVSHTARFALTSFLLNLGYTVDEILQMFRTAPDFDEEKARYQIEHISGKRGAGKEYEVPSCSTMKTYHNCVAECRVSHPLEYYRRRVHEGGGRKAEGKGGRSEAHS